MFSTARILYSEYLDAEKNVMIGGAQNYIRCLSEVLLSLEIYPIIYQYGKTSYNAIKNGYTVISVKNAKTPQDLIRYIDCHNHSYDNDLLIFGTDFLICKNKFKASIAIQHGIAWDINTDRHVSDLTNYIQIIKSTFRSIKKYNRYRYCKNIVCVDYNFINWYRTQVAHIDMDCVVIPNFAVCENIKPRKITKEVSIVFARRLVEYRGTRLFTNSIIPLLKKYNNISVTIAGVGPDEDWMRKKLSSFSKVNFTSFSAENSVSFHSDYDIAVVPTKGSEGTSLSLLEAMSAGCAVVVTNVGGMTNIILDGYNGLIVNPENKDLSFAIEKLIIDKELREKLQKNATETVHESFSYSQWKNRWIELINKIYG